MMSPDQVIELVERVAHIDANLNTLSRRLLGNGQAGELAMLSARLRATEDYIVAAKTRSVMLGAAGGALVSSGILLLRVLLRG